MRHLNPETLARLVDEEGDAIEREHLRSCDECAEALAELRRQTEALATLPEIRPPAGDWAQLERRLRGERLIRERGAGTGRPPESGGARRSRWLRVAAAIAIFVAGSGFGTLLARVAPEDPVGTSMTAGTPAESGEPGSADLASAPRTSEEATELLRAAEARYVDALVAYREFIGGRYDGGPITDPASRFAALETLMEASQAAIREAPADPFLNGILATTMAERRATLRQISSGSDDDWY